LFIPGTIGSITWLARNEAQVGRIKHGLVVACLGDNGGLTYKRSRQGSAEIDRAVSHVLRHSGEQHEIREFSPWGYDERQYCSPGFNLPVGLLSRTPHGRFPEYHTSADNLDFVQPDALGDSFVKCLTIVNVLENNKRWINQNPKCEPQLGRRGIYRAAGGQAQGPSHELAMLWVLSLSDGHHSMLDIADRAGMEFEHIRIAADTLAEHGLLKEASHGADASLSCASLSNSSLLFGQRHITS
jgi:aminopeptidase-like protein